MSAIRWNELAPDLYEAVVKVLVHLAYPAAQPVDGAGGDRGRDLQLETSAGLHVFELKSFSGRVSREHGRRKQVERSLERAAELQPAQWTLIVPTDPTDGELAWFDSLQSRYAFTLEWLGKAWLDRQAAKYPEVGRYFLDGGEVRALEYLRELHKEQAALAGGAPDAAERVGRVVARLNELDPYYVFDLAVEGGTTRIAIRPRFAGAEELRPITGSLRFEFPDTAEAREVYDRLADVLAFGGSVEVPSEFVPAMELDAPAQLGGQFTDVAVSLSPVDEDWQVAGRFVVTSEAGAETRALDLQFTRRHSGTRGGVIYGTDVHGILNVEGRLDTVERQADLTINLRVPDRFYPADLLPVLDVLEAARPPNAAHLEIAGTALGRPLPIPADLGVELPQTFVDLMRALVRVQNETRRHFALPAELTPADVVAIRHADRLLRGDSIEERVSEISMKMGVVNADAIRGWAVSGDPGPVLVEAEHGVLIAGQEVNLGRVRIEFPKMCLTNPEAVLGALDEPTADEIEVALAPRSEEPSRMFLLPRDG